MNGTFRSNYLKVVSKDDNHKLQDLSFALSKYETIIYQEDRRDGKSSEAFFGYFYEILRTDDWSLLRFSPYSQDWNISEKATSYETQDKALEAAINFLDTEGYKAKSFDLELLINEIDL